MCILPVLHLDLWLLNLGDLRVTVAIRQRAFGKHMTDPLTNVAVGNR